MQSDEKQILEAKIAELTGDVEEKKKSAAALSSILKEAEVGVVAAAARVSVARHSTRPLRRQEEIRSLRNKMEKSETHRRDLSHTVEELMLICDTSEKELNKLVCVEQVSRWYLFISTLESVTAPSSARTSHAGHQDAMVENNILKVEVKRVRDLLFNQLDSMYSLEKRKLDLQRTIKEREEDIMIFRKMLSQQLRTSEEERQRLRFVFSSGSYCNIC